MATSCSPCKGSYVLDQFPSNVMFGMNGFHVTASGAIQGHHGPLVSNLVGHFRVQRISDKALVLQDECLPKGTRPTLICTRPFSNQFKLKVPKQFSSLRFW